MNQEHYISKLERNTNVLDKAPEHIKQQCSEHIIWARNLIARLEQLDYQEREKAPEVIFNTGEIRLREEDYLDEDVDDYYEKNGNNNQDEYLDEDVDDYREKN